MHQDFSSAWLAPLGRAVRRLGLSASYRPGIRAIHRALDQGVNLVFLYGFDSQMARVLRELPPARRDELVVVTGAYNYGLTHQPLARTLERRLRLLNTDYIDIFLFLGVTKPAHFPPSLQEQLHKLKEGGRVRAIGISCHHRAFAGKLASQRAVDFLMVRYNAAHPGAEQDIFPHVGPEGPAVIAYTATCWGRLLRRPRGWSPNLPPATATMCYRFALAHPAVDVCLTAPSTEAQLIENLHTLAAGPLAGEERDYMLKLGTAVRRSAWWFW